MKSRSSTGVGQKIDLDYNIETMRITDDDPDGYAEQQAKYKQQPSANDIMKTLKPMSTIQSSTPIIDAETGELLEAANKHVVADVQSTKLKNLLNSLKK